MNIKCRRPAGYEDHVITFDGDEVKYAVLYGAEKVVLNFGGALNKPFYDLEPRIGALYCPHNLPSLANELIMRGHLAIAEIGKEYKRLLAERILKTGRPISLKRPFNAYVAVIGAELGRHNVGSKKHELIMADLEKTVLYFEEHDSVDVVRNYFCWFDPDVPCGRPF